MQWHPSKSPITDGIVLRSLLDGSLLRPIGMRWKLLVLSHLAYTQYIYIGDFANAIYASVLWTLYVI